MWDIFFVEKYEKTLHFPSEFDHIIDNNDRSIVCMGNDRKKEIKSQTLVSVDKYEVIVLRQSRYHLESISEMSMNPIIKTTFMKISECLLVCWDRLFDCCNTRSFTECTCDPECGISICGANLEYTLWREGSSHIVQISPHFWRDIWNLSLKTLGFEGGEVGEEVRCQSHTKGDFCEYNLICYEGKNYGVPPPPAPGGGFSSNIFFTSTLRLVSSMESDFKLNAFSICVLI